MRTSTSATPGVGTGLLTRFNSPGSPSTHAFIVSIIFQRYMIRFRSSKSIGSVSVLIASGVYNRPFEHGVYPKEALMKLGRLVRLTVALLALPLLAYAQDATLSGTVK